VVRCHEDGIVGSPPPRLPMASIPAIRHGPHPQCLVRDSPSASCSGESVTRAPPHRLSVSTGWVRASRVSATRSDGGWARRPERSPQTRTQIFISSSHVGHRIRTLIHTEIREAESEGGCSLKKIPSLVTLAGVLAVLSLSLNACEFSFSFDSIAAPLGAVGEIGIRVQKTHPKCVLPSMDSYEISGRGIQILGETDWEEIDDGLFEKWLNISLSSLGSGDLKISKFCSKEGYEEGILPIMMLEPNEDGVWATARAGEYPFTTPVGTFVTSVVGPPKAGDGWIEVGEAHFEVPEAIELPKSLPEEVRLFYESSEESGVLLLVGEGLFVRFDHLAH
jgi:hypothetical protein